eukprot:gene14154-30133_t
MSYSGNVLEHDDATEKLLELLRISVDHKVDELGGERKEVLELMIEEMDNRYQSVSNGLDRKLFGRFLRLLHIHFSNVECFHLFNMIDINKNRIIDVNEFLTAVYPSEAQKLQRLHDEEVLIRAAHLHMQIEADRLAEYEDEESRKEQLRKNTAFGIAATGFVNTLKENFLDGNSSRSSSGRARNSQSRSQGHSQRSNNRYSNRISYSGGKHRDDDLRLLSFSAKYNTKRRNSSFMVPATGSG